MNSCLRGTELEYLFVLLAQREVRTPRTGEERGVVDGELVPDEVGPHHRDAFHQVQSAVEATAWATLAQRITEVRRVDHQRIAIPAPSRIAGPLLYAVGRMWTAVEWHDPTIPSVLLHQDQVVWRLEDLQNRWACSRYCGAPDNLQASFAERNVFSAVVSFLDRRLLEARRDIGDASVFWFEDE